MYKKLFFLSIIVCAISTAAIYKKYSSTKYKLNEALQRQNLLEEKESPNREKLIFISNDSELTKILTNVVDATSKEEVSNTNLCNIMNEEKSDKAGPIHNYTQVYSILFDKLQNQKINLLEIGIGTNNIDVPSNMGPEGTPGASLRGWKRYFPQGMVYGADVDDRILFEEDRIKTYYVDQLNTRSIDEMFKKIGNVDFDIIIEDGLHTYDANINFLENSFPFLKKGGIYIVEDVAAENNIIMKWYKYLQEKKLKGAIIRANNEKDKYQCLVIIRKD